MITKEEILQLEIGDILKHETEKFKDFWTILEKPIVDSYGCARFLAYGCVNEKRCLLAKCRLENWMHEYVTKII